MNRLDTDENCPWVKQAVKDHNRAPAPVEPLINLARIKHISNRVILFAVSAFAGYAFVWLVLR